MNINLDDQQVDQNNNDTKNWDLVSPGSMNKVVHTNFDSNESSDDLFQTLRMSRQTL
jgi:hypothetical protein